MSDLDTHAERPRKNRKLRERQGARYESAMLVLEIALRLAGSRRGLSISEIMEAWKLSRSTANRLLDALRDFNGFRLASLPGSDGDHPNTIRWRLEGARMSALALPAQSEIDALEFAVRLLAVPETASTAAQLVTLRDKLRILAPVGHSAPANDQD